MECRKRDSWLTQELIPTTQVSLSLEDLAVMEVRLKMEGVTGNQFSLGFFILKDRHVQNMEGLLGRVQA